ncbi:MAG: hypothetical protein F6K28_54790 [Microcoleus sp. SIO2G3]|nr:hypothetical protein [Microcoleus sp. SIO2G3]
MDSTAPSAKSPSGAIEPEKFSGNQQTGKRFSDFFDGRRRRIDKAIPQGGASGDFLCEFDFAAERSPAKATKRSLQCSTERLRVIEQIKHRPLSISSAPVLNG